MPAEHDLKILAQSPAFGRLTDAERATVAAAMIQRELRPSEVLWRIGVPLSEPGLCLVVRGEVSVALNARTGAVPLSRTATAGSVFGEGTLFAQGPSTVGARSVTAARLLRLPRDRFQRLTAEIPALAQLVEDLGELRALEPEVLAGLRRSALSKHFSPRSLGELCEVADIAALRPGDVALRQGEDAPGFFFVVSGSLQVTVSLGEGAAPVVVDTLHPGDVFGDVALVYGGQQPTTVTAIGPVRVARVRSDTYRRLLAQSQTHRRGRAEAPAGALAAPIEHARPSETRLFLGEPGTPVGPLSALVADWLASHHHDHVLLVGFAPEGDGATSVARVGPRVLRATVPTDDTSAGARLSELLAEHGARFDYVFLDVGTRGDALIASLAHRVDRAVYVSRDPSTSSRTAVLGDVGVLHAALLGAPHAAAASSMASFPAGTVRIRLDLERLARRSDARLADLPLHEAASVGRLARAVSNRRVGVALGGGGAWGYAHLTLLRAITAARVPIDIVAGCSFGAVVGAYWCALGEDGAALLLRRANALRLAVAQGFISSRSVSRLVDNDLGGRELEDLDVPFFPVATDVATGTQRAIKGGTIGRGVRASGAFPLTFSPVTSKGYRLVDGGIINNVPEDVVAQEGADLVIASNVVSQPAPMSSVPQPLVPERWGGRFLHELNPLGRLSDMVRSMLILMHSAGSRDAHLADVTYDADPTAVMPWDFGNGEQIARDATPKVEKVIRDITAAWEHLSLPAVERDEIGAEDP
jgi:predicted acylesterase/phospholipase RssA/CRP-like cAMP-binding protein